MKTHLFIIVLLLNTLSLFSSVKLTGVVKDSNGMPIDFVLVYTNDERNATYTRQDGGYSMDLHPGEYVVIARILGYEAQQKNIKLEDNKSYKLDFVLKEDVLSLKGVTVTAEVKESEEGTSVYTIGSQAIQQIQAVNLGDILTLLPGKQIGSTSLNSVQQANIRTASSSASNNFGTAVIVDGLAISNDANMQASNPATSMSGGAASVAAGIDLRSINAGSIESVEVVTGVASPKYGNISSGAIIVKSKVGVSPLFVSANINPNAYQLSLSRGDKVGNLGHIHYSLSGTYSDASSTDNKNYYMNVNANVRWQLLLSEKYEWYHTTSLIFSAADNGQRLDPDLTHTNYSDVKNQSYSINLNGSADVLGALSYNMGFNANNQYSNFITTNPNGPFPLVSMEESGTYFASFSPLVVEEEVLLRGLPVSFNARVEADQQIHLKNTNIQFNTGLEYKVDKNFGSGRTSAGTAVMGNLPSSRNAKFHEVPATNIISAYHETKLSHEYKKYKTQVRLGLRYDNMYFKYNLLSPRVSAQFSYDKINLRASYGVAYKVPAMIQLYPGPAYLDYTNKMDYNTNPNKRYAIVSSYVYQPKNEHLRPYRGDMYEVGLDWNNEYVPIRLTYFHKVTKNTINTLEEIRILNKKEYAVVETFENEVPKLEETGKVTKLVRTVNLMANNGQNTTDGIEVVINPKKIKPTNTEFNFNYSIMRTDSYDNGHDIRINKYDVEDSDAHMGVYDNSVYRTWLSRSNLTLVQHIPKLSLVVTLTSELNFINYSETLYGSIYANAYYDADGLYYKIPEEERHSEKYLHLRLCNLPFAN